eukprot:scpid60247/ scgid34434/ 
MGFLLGSSEGQLTMSVSDVASGSAEHTLTLFKEVIGELSAVGEHTGRTNAGEKLLCSLQNTMTDRAAVNAKFNELLGKYRQDVLSATVPDWDELSDQEKASLSKMNNHFCGLHMLVNLAEQCNAVLREYESSQVEGEAAKSSEEAGAIRLIRTACKAFERHGSEKAGRMVDFATFCASRGITALPLAAFRGNRFNILFFDAAGVHFLKALMTEYCSFAEKNRLIEAVAKDLDDQRYLAGCRALGIIGKIVTGPLWRFLVSARPFTDVFTIYHQLTQQLAVWAEDASDLLDGSGRPFPEADVHTATPVFDALVEPASSDAEVKEVLQLLAATFHSYMARAWSAYLPGGDLTTADTASMRHLPKTNVLSEHDFGQLDRFLREKPNATTLAIESMIMLANNKTMSWLAAKSEADKAAILKAARASVPYQKQLAKQRKLAIQAHRQKHLQQQQEKKKRQQERQTQLVQSSTLALAKYGGLWTTELDLATNVSKLNTQQGKRDALKCQLRFRKYVMAQYNKENQARFAFSKDGKQLAIEEMSSNLLALIAASSSATAETTPTGSAAAEDELEEFELEPEAEEPAELPAPQ